MVIVLVVFAEAGAKPYMPTAAKSSAAKVATRVNRQFLLCFFISVLFPISFD